MRRWALRVFLILLLGAIVNVAVAWGCLLGLRHRSDTIEDWDDDASVHAIVAELGWDVESWRFFAGVTDHDFGVMQREVSMYSPRTETSAPFGVIVATSTDAGWPLYAPTGRIIWPHNSYLEWRANGQAMKPDRKVECGWAYSAIVTTPKFRTTETLLVPLRPVWPAFAFNTVFYAAVLWMLFAAPFALRKWQRIKRGLCPKCGYDLRGTDSAACPECGASDSREGPANP
jgi:hypothetical protein